VRKNIKTYEKVQAEGLNQKQLILLCYNGIIRFLNGAKEALEDNKNLDAHNSLDKARKIVFHLLSTLNFEAGGEIAEKLRVLYVFLIEKITEANMKKDSEIVDEIIPIVATVQEGWEGIELSDSSIPKEKKGIVGDMSGKLSITV